MGKNLADVEYKMRMTQDLKDKIVESAKEHNRSMNADIVARLEESFLKTENSSTQGDLLPHVDYDTATYNEQYDYIAIQAKQCSSSSCRDNFIDYMNMTNCVKLTLFPINNPKNNRIFLGALALVISYGVKYYILFNSSYLNSGSDHASRELKQFIDEAINKSKVFFINNSIHFTDEIDLLDTVEKLKTLPLEPLTDSSVGALLNLLR